jgi:hypothetical protein
MLLLASKRRYVPGVFWGGSWSVLGSLARFLLKVQQEGLPGREQGTPRRLCEV